MLRKIFLLLILSCALTTPSWALTLTLEGAANFSSGKDSSATGGAEHTGKLGLGGGAEVGLTYGSWGLDFGALYLQRKYGTTVSVSGMNAEAVTLQKGFQVPVLVRYWLGKVIAFGLGGYYF